MPGKFLTARWRHLVMLNYEIDPAVLHPLVPSGCELDSWQGRFYASMVGFLFLDTRIFGIPIPGHRDFEEVNLRFYVRREIQGELRRGVVFVKELVPRWAIALVARSVYNENYQSLPMRHAIVETPRIDCTYEWRQGGSWSGLSLEASGAPALVEPGSEEEFITEHYWGYSAQPSGGTLEYQVEHPCWRVWRGENARLVCDAKSLYGPEFVEPLGAKPTSCFIAEGSEVAVRRARRLH